MLYSIQIGMIFTAETMTIAMFYNEGQSFILSFWFYLFALTLIWLMNYATGYIFWTKTERSDKKVQKQVKEAFVSYLVFMTLQMITIVGFLQYLKYECPFYQQRTSEWIESFFFLWFLDLFADFAVMVLLLAFKESGCAGVLKGALKIVGIRGYCRV